MNKRSHDTNKLALILVSSVGINFNLMLTFWGGGGGGAGNQSSIIFVVILFLLFPMKLLRKYFKLESI